MIENSDWYPTTRAGQRAMYGNFRAKIDGYRITLGLTGDQVTRLILICDLYIAIYDWLILVEATKTETTRWRDELEQGDESNPVQPPPDFVELILPNGAFNGFVREFRDTVGLIKRLDGYTQAIGLDLMVVRLKGAPPNLNEAQPDFKFESKNPFKVRVTGKMQGFKTANFYYRRKGENNYVFVGYLTNMPGELTIPAATPGVPEVGDIKAIFVEKNVEVGIFSPSTELTLS